jgi:hypothetical protein
VPPTAEGLARGGIELIDLGGALDACGVYVSMAASEASPRLSQDPHDEWRILSADGIAMLRKMRDLGFAEGGEDNVVYKASGWSSLHCFAAHGTPAGLSRPTSWSR